MDDSLLDALEIETWSESSNEEKRRTVEAALAALQDERGCRFGSLRLEECGPANGRRTVAVVTHEESRMEFCLVPGGWFSPGLGQRRREKLFQLLMQMNGTPEVPPYGSHADPKICFSPDREVPVRPFFIARFPLTKGDEIITRDLDENILARGVDPAAPQHPRRYLPLRIQEVDAISKRFGWEVPHAVYLEWAIGAGAPHLFYWGDELEYETMSVQGNRHPLLALHDAGDSPWPATTAFGIRGAVGVPQWCFLPVKGGKLLLVRGGAGVCAPWQNCGEFLWLVNFMAVPWDDIEESNDAHAFRPMISL